MKAHEALPEDSQSRVDIRVRMEKKAYGQGSLWHSRPLLPSGSPESALGGRVAEEVVILRATMKVRTHLPTYF